MAVADAEYLATKYLPAPKKTLLPTRKLSYAAVSAIVLFVVSLFVHGIDPQLEQAVNFGVPLILAYLVPNADTIGGVPVKVDDVTVPAPQPVNVPAKATL